MKKSKKMFVIVMVFLLFINSLPTVTFAVEENSGTISKEDFVEMIHDHEFYDEYQDYFISEEFDVITEFKDENMNTLGIMARMELEYNNDISEIVNFTSYLVFTYEYTDHVLNVYLVDNSQLYTEKNIVIENLVLGNTEIIDVSEEEVFQEFYDELEKEIEEEF